MDLRLEGGLAVRCSDCGKRLLFNLIQIGLMKKRVVVLENEVWNMT